MDKREIISSIVWFCIVAIVTISSIDLGIGEFHNPGPGFFPFWSGVFIALLTLIMLASHLSKKVAAISLADLWKGDHWGTLVAVIASLIVYCLVLVKLGYILATTGLMLILFYLGKMKPWAIIVGSLLAVLLSYGLFHYGLRTPLPKGILDF
ncbi:MAG: tripartite tricarboxylate transporter TctB family protein [Smithellaceae bacterium]